MKIKAVILQGWSYTMGSGSGGLAKKEKKVRVLTTSSLTYRSGPDSGFYAVTPRLANRYHYCLQTAKRIKLRS